jgi:hypothetical protein
LEPVRLFIEDTKLVEAGGCLLVEGLKRIVDRHLVGCVEEFSRRQDRALGALLNSVNQGLLLYCLLSVPVLSDEPFNDKVEVAYRFMFAPDLPKQLTHHCHGLRVAIKTLGGKSSFSFECSLHAPLALVTLGILGCHVISVETKRG